MVFQHCSSVRAHCSQSLGNKQKNLEYLHRGKGMSSYKKSAAATGPPQPLACLLLQLLGKDRASNPHLNPPWRFIYKALWGKAYGITPSDFYQDSVSHHFYGACFIQVLVILQPKQAAKSQQHKQGKKAIGVIYRSINFMDERKGKWSCSYSGLSIRDKNLNNNISLHRSGSQGYNFTLHLWYHLQLLY